MRILMCSIRHVCLHEGGNRINGFTIHEEGCCLGEGKAVPRGMCEYVCSLKSTIPGVSFVPHKELWLCSVPALRHRWSLGQRNSIPQLTTTGLCSPRSDKSAKIKLKKNQNKNEKSVPASSFLLNYPSGVISPGAKATKQRPRPGGRDPAAGRWEVTTLTELGVMEKWGQQDFFSKKKGL